MYTTDREIPQIDFWEIKAAQEDGVSSEELSREYFLSLVKINEIFASLNYEQFISKYQK